MNSKMSPKSLPEIHISTRKQWRKWLEKNHKKHSKVGVIKYKKHTGKPTISHQESMDEAICFGWIDTTVKRLDEDRYLRYFARRTDKSRWSNATLSYAKRLTKAGLMSEEGMKRYEEGLKKPVIDHGLPRNPDTPKELQKLLNKNKPSKEKFEKLSPSARRSYIYWIERAKRPETRENRVKKVFENLKEK